MTTPGGPNPPAVDRALATVGPSFTTAVFDLARRRAGVASVVGTVVLLVSAAVLLLSRPVYRAEARLKIGEPPPTAGISPTGGLLSFLRTGGDPFSNDLEVLSSRTLAEDVVRDAALSVRLKAPRGWYRDSLFVSLALQDTTTKATFEATWGDGSVTVRQLAPEKGEVGTFPVGTPAVFGGMRAVFAPAREDAPSSVRLTTQPFDEAVRLTAQRIKTARTRRDANVLELSYTSDDPGVAAAVVESAVRRFVELRIRLFERESHETVDSLRTVAAGTRRDLAEAEDSLEGVQRRTGLVATDAQSEALIDRYETIHGALEEAKAEREALDAQAERIKNGADDVASWSTLVANPRFLANLTVGELLTRLNELEAQRTEVLALRRPTSLDARTLDTEIEQLGGTLKALVAEYRTGLDDRVDELAAREADLNTVLRRLPSEALELGRRQRAVRILSEVLVLTEQRLRQEELRQALAFSNIQVVDPPRLRFRPVWPRKKLGLAIAVVLAFGAGVFTALVSERADPTLRRADRVRALAGAPVLAAPRAGMPLSEAEQEAIRGATGGTLVPVPCEGVGVDAARVLEVLRERCEIGPPAAVDGFAAAAAVVRAGAPVLLLVRVGVTTEQEVARVVGLIHEAGGSVGGVVALTSSSREGKALWA